MNFCYDIDDENKKDLIDLEIFQEVSDNDKKFQKEVLAVYCEEALQYICHMDEHSLDFILNKLLESNLSIGAKRFSCWCKYYIQKRKNREEIQLNEVKNNLLLLLQCTVFHVKEMLKDTTD